MPFPLSNRLHFKSIFKVHYRFILIYFLISHCYQYGPWYLNATKLSKPKNHLNFIKYGVSAKVGRFAFSVEQSIRFQEHFQDPSSFYFNLFFNQSVLPVRPMISWCYQVVKTIKSSNYGVSGKVIRFAFSVEQSIPFQMHFQDPLSFYFNLFFNQS